MTVLDASPKRDWSSTALRPPLRVFDDKPRRWRPLLPSGYLTPKRLRAALFFIVILAFMMWVSEKGEVLAPRDLTGEALVRGSQETAIGAVEKPISTCKVTVVEDEEEVEAGELEWGNVEEGEAETAVGLPAEAPVVLPRKANAAILFLVSPRLEDLRRGLYLSLENIEARWNAKRGYDIILLTDPVLPPKSVMRETQRITGGKAIWGVLEPKDGWGPPSWISEDEIDESVRRLHFSKGYRNMCRFYSGFFWRHPLLKKYEYIMRLDTKIQFHCDLQYDPFLEMIREQALYGYVITSDEAPRVSEGLWDTTKEFFARSPASFVADNNNLPMISDDGGETWNYKVFYNNYFLAHRSVFESKAWNAYFEHLDKLGGIYRGRWGDAPIHTLGLSHILPAKAFLNFSVTTEHRHPSGYQHGHMGHQAWFCPRLPFCQCPAGSVPDVRGERQLLDPLGSSNACSDEAQKCL